MTEHTIQKALGQVLRSCAHARELKYNMANILANEALGDAEHLDEVRNAYFGRLSKKQICAVLSNARAAECERFAELSDNHEVLLQALDVARATIDAA